MNWISFMIGFFTAFATFCGISAGVTRFMLKNPHILMRRMMKAGSSQKRKAA